MFNNLLRKKKAKLVQNIGPDFNVLRENVINRLEKNGANIETFIHILNHYAANYMHYEPLDIGDFKIFSGNDPRSCMKCVDDIISSVYKSYDEKIDFLLKFKDFCPDGKNINITNIRVCTLLIAYYYFLQEKYVDCMEYLHAAIKINSICMISSWMYAQILRKINPQIWKTTEKWFCSKPFDQAWVINEGEVYACCPAYMQISIGNAYEQEWKEIWNSDVAQEIRSSILDGSFKYCNWFFCPTISDNFLLGKTNKENCPSVNNLPKYKKFMDLNQPLRLAGVANDYTCNLRCPSCRDDFFSLSDGQKIKLEQAKEKIIIPLIKNSTEFHLSGGEPFASKYNKQLLAAINKNDFPYLKKLKITSNGLLLDEKQWNKIHNVHYLDIDLIVSVDASTKETYKIVRRGGDFEDLMRNLKFLSKLRKQKKLNSLSLNYVVQDHNFREMRDFVLLGLDLEVDFITFQKIYNAGNFTEEEFSRRTVFEPSHPEYNNFQNILRLPIFEKHKKMLRFAGFETFFKTASMSSDNLEKEF